MVTKNSHTQVQGMTFIAVTIIVIAFLFLNRKGYAWPLTLPTLTMLAFSVIGVDVYSSIDSKEYYFLLFSPGAFIIITAVLISKAAKIPHNPNLENINVARIVFLILIAITFISALLANLSGGGDNRIVAYKNFRALSLLLFSGNLVLIYYFSLLIGRGKLHKIDISLIVTYIIGLVVSGSKGAALGTIFVIYGVYLVSINYASGSKKKPTGSIWFALTSILILFFSVAWSKGFYDLMSIINVVVTRILNTGDLYHYWSLLSESFTGYSNYFSYLFHPFTALVGIRGYDLPFGAELFCRVTGDDSGFGPNPHLSLLSFVLADNDIFLGILLMISSLLLMYTLVFISTAIMKKLFYSFSRAYSLHINVCFLLIFTDIGMFEFIFIGSFMWFVVIYFVRLLFKMPKIHIKGATDI